MWTMPPSTSTNKTMGPRFFYTTNSGLLFDAGATAIGVDLLFRKSPGFSGQPETVLQELFSGTGTLPRPDLLLFTHRPPDHYDEDLVTQFRATARDGTTAGAVPGHPSVCLPGERFGSIPPGIRIGQWAVLPCPTAHDGSSFRNVPHFSYFLTHGTRRFLIAGDAILHDHFIKNYWRLGKIDTGFFNVYQLNDPTVQHLIGTFQMKHVYIDHLPEKEDDRYHYHEQLKTVLERYPCWLPEPKFLQPFSWVDPA